MSCHVIECGSCARYDCRRQRRAVLYTSVIRELSTMSGSTASVSTTLSSLTHLVSLSRPQRHQSHLASHSGTMIRLLLCVVLFISWFHRCIALMWALMQGIFQDLENGGVSTNPWGSLPFPSPLCSLSPPSPYPLSLLSPWSQGVLCESWGVLTEGGVGNSLHWCIKLSTDERNITPWWIICLHVRGIFFCWQFLD